MLRGWAELQRVSASAQMAVRIRDACDAIDLPAETLARVRAPTLVLHCRGDSVAPFDQGRRLAAGIPGARFAALESDNHVVLPDEPEWARMLGEIARFLADG
jgi:pimeloyl-ACP methyl ester carboxylesterase